MALRIHFQRTPMVRGDLKQEIFYLFEFQLDFFLPDWPRLLPPQHPDGGITLANAEPSLHAEAWDVRRNSNLLGG
jgi:hypothetical protein